MNPVSVIVVAVCVINLGLADDKDRRLLVPGSDPTIIHHLEVKLQELTAKVDQATQYGNVTHSLATEIDRL